MVRQDSLVKRTAFNAYVCDNCGKSMGRHYLYRPDKLGDVIENASGRKPNGVLYCHKDQSGKATSYHQRELARTLHPAYTLERVGKSGSNASV